MDTNTILITLVILFALASAAGMWVGIRLVRAGGSTLRPSQYPTLRAPSIPTEFATGEWKTAP